MTGIVVAVVAAAGLLIGMVVTASMTALGQEFVNSALLGLALAGVCATFAAVAALASQLVEVRRRAAGLAAAALGVAWIVRMVGASTDPRAWLQWFTPLGWMDRLHLYGDPDPVALIPLVLAPVALGRSRWACVPAGTPAPPCWSPSPAARRGWASSAARRHSHGAGPVPVQPSRPGPCRALGRHVRPGHDRPRDPARPGGLLTFRRRDLTNA